MKNLFILISIVILSTIDSFAQTSIFGENFESGGGNWILNSGSEGGVGSDPTSNQWVINNVYTGFFGNTPIQPVEINGSPQSNYLHINSPSLAQNCVYLDAGSMAFFGGVPGLNFVEMNGDISTLGFSGVHLSFFWIGQGNLGQTYYSINGGVDWISVGGDFNGQPNWEQIDIVDSAFDEQPIIRFAFSFDNTAGIAVADPAFGIDDILLYEPSESNNDPLASFNASVTEVCEGETITFTDNSTVSGTTTYNWTFENGTPNSANTQGPHTITFNSNGTQEITLTVTDENGTDNFSSNVTIIGNADASITAAGPFCVTDSTVPLTSASSGGTWSGTGIVNTSTGSFNPSVAGAGNHTITYTIAGACGDEQTISIVVTASSDVSITQAGPFCPGDPVVFLSAAIDGGTWSGTGIINASTGEFDPSEASFGNNEITYTIAGGCGGSDMISIVIDELDDPTITEVGPFCETGNVVFLSAVDPGGTWSGAGIVNTTTGEFDPNDANVGNNEITYTIPGGCGNSDTITIVITELADVSITAAGPFCPDDTSVLLEAAPLGGTWSGTGIVDANTGEFDPTISGEGNFEITYTISGDCGGSEVFSIAVTGTPDATITEVNSALCVSDDSIILEAATSGGTWSGEGVNETSGAFNPAVAGSGIHIITYTLISSCGNANDSIEITVEENADASFTVVADLCSNSGPIQLEAENAGGTWSGTGISDSGVFNPLDAGVGVHEITYAIEGVCGDSQSMNINVNEMADATILPSNEFCVLDDPSFLVSENEGGQWSGVGIVDATTGEFDPATAGVGVHDVMYTIMGDCGDSQTATIVVVNMLSAAISSVDPLCDNDDSISLSAENEGGTWSGTGVGVESGVFSPSVAGAGTHVITYAILGSCGDVQNINIVVNASQVVTISDQSNMCIDDDIVSLEGFPLGGIWTGMGIDDNGNFDPIVAGEGSHVISYQLDDLCQSSSFQSILVDLCADMNIYLPTAFSPNDDGQNDLLFVRGNGIKKVNLVVFDRWGEEVFSTNSLAIGWDGTYKGAKLNPATFYYSLIATMNDDSKINRTGSILLSK